jgi:hypothetical protein
MLTPRAASLLTLEGSVHRRVTRFVMPTIAVMSLLVFAACSDDDDETQAPMSAEERTAFCRDLANVQESLADVRQQMPGAVISANQAAYQDALQKARADVNALDSSARELEGGSDLVADLREDIDEYRRLLATPDLISVAPQLQQQAEVIADDLDQLSASAQCPSGGTRRPAGGGTPAR